MRSTLTALVLAALIAPAAVVHAQEDNQWDGGFDAPPAERRSDVTIGASASLVLGTASGYPNELSKLDRPEFEANTGAATGTVLSAWLGGALRDFLSVGVGFFTLSLKGDAAASGAGAILRLETFPLFDLGGVYRDLSLFGNFGIGQVTIQEGGDETADGGSMSVVGVGAFWEAWRTGHFAFGPSLQYDHMWSQTLSYHGGLLGLRVAFYGGPSEPAVTTARR